jgi:hypothetical protein
MKRLVPIPALVLLLVAATQVRAANIDWSYNWSRTPPAILVGTGGISFTDQPLTPAANSSDIVATNLKVFSSADPGAPDQIGSAGKYSLTLTITDTASGKSGSLTWDGQLNGSFSVSSSNVSSTSLSLVNNSQGGTNWFLKLGNNVFTISNFVYSPPGDPQDPHTGSIGAHVDVSPGSGPTVNSPEPATLLLSFVGLSVFGGVAWRRRRPLAV